RSITLVDDRAGAPGARRFRRAVLGKCEHRGKRPSSGGIPGACARGSVAALQEREEARIIVAQPFEDASMDPGGVLRIAPIDRKSAARQEPGEQFHDRVAARTLPGARDQIARGNVGLPLRPPLLPRGGRRSGRDRLSMDAPGRGKAAGDHDGQAESDDPSRFRSWLRGAHHSHSIVPGGLEVMSYVTRLIPFTSFTIRFAERSSTSYGSRAQSAVIPSTLVTARNTATCS